MWSKAKSVALKQTEGQSQKTLVGQKHASRESLGANAQTSGQRLKAVDFAAGY